jgi:hypothetical protein
MEITTREAHKLTGYSESHLRSLAREGQVKARKRRRRWYFNRRDLLIYSSASLDASEIPTTPSNVRASDEEIRRPRPTVFVSYSHRDEEEKQELLTHLGVLRRAGLIELVWSDDRIDPGVNWRREIIDAINRARIAILLISAHFLDSDFIHETEIPLLLERRNRDDFIIIPVIAKACVWRKFGWLAEMQVRPRNGRPIWGAGSRKVDAQLAAIAGEISDIVEQRGW